MQTANVLLALGGDQNNTVPKYAVTASEVAVLRRIHGDDSVRDIEVVGEVKRTHRQEIGRLTEAYGRRDGERRIAPEVNELFPGAAARVFETFDELEIPEEFYAADRRQDTKPRKEAPAEKSVDDMSVNELRAHADKIGCDLTGVTKKADILEAIRAHEAPQGDGDEGEGDGDEDMNDGMFD